MDGDGSQEPGGSARRVVANRQVAVRREAL